MKRKKRTILVVSYILAAFAAMGGLALSWYSQAQAARLQLENSYRHAFTELASEVGALDAALQKSVYATSPAFLSAVCTEIYGKSLSAQYALGEMPFGSHEVENMSGFITKTGDYALMLSRKAGSGIAGSDDEIQNLTKLSQTATILANNLNDLMAEFEKTGMSISSMKALTSEAAKAADEVTGAALENGFTTMESEFPDTPTLIYDGPFSSHIGGLKPKVTEGKMVVTKEQAMDIAATFMHIDISKLKADGEREGNLPVYNFYANTDGGTVSVEVTKQGGIVASAFNSRVVRSSNISAKDALKIASRFLEKAGYKNMKQSYEIIDSNILVVNYAYTQNDVICYPDLVKVSVALDNGKIVGFESLGYIMNHSERTINKAAFGEAAAKEKVSTQLKVLSHHMAIIPTEGKNEVLCHEFKCESENGSHYIVYINADSGEQQKILILIEDKNGTLTI